MMLSLYLALFLPSAVMTVILAVYICLLCYTSSHLPQTTVKPTARNGFSLSALDKLPRTTGKELGSAVECAICLDDIEAEQPARGVPGCNHGFHLQCVDTWLLKNPMCPVCRNKLDPDFSDGMKQTLAERLKLL